MKTINSHFHTVSLTIFQSYTLSILHSSNLTLYQSLTLLHSYNFIISQIGYIFSSLDYFLLTNNVYTRDSIGSKNFYLNQPKKWYPNYLSICIRIWSSRSRVSCCVRNPLKQFFKFFIVSKRGNHGSIVLWTCVHTFGPFKFLCVKLNSTHS